MNILSSALTLKLYRQLLYKDCDVERIIFRLNESISASQEERSRQLLEKDSEHAFDAFAGKLSLPVLFVVIFLASFSVLCWLRLFRPLLIFEMFEFERSILCKQALTIPFQLGYQGPIPPILSHPFQYFEYLAPVLWFRSQSEQHHLLDPDPELDTDSYQFQPNVKLKFGTFRSRIIVPHKNTKKVFFVFILSVEAHLEADPNAF